MSIAAALIRHLLTLVGGGLIASGSLTQDDLTALIGAITTIVGVIWSVVQKLPRQPPSA